VQRAEVRKMLVGALVLGALATAAHLVEAWWQTNPLGAAIVGAVMIDIVGGRLGLEWDEGGKAKTAALASFSLRGFALGAGVALLVAALAAAFGWARISRGSPTIVGLGLGLAAPLAFAARDELLYRGLPLLLMRGRIPDRYALPFCALLGAAPLALKPGASLIGVVLAASSGAFFAILWRIGRGAWVAWGAHAGWLFMAGAGIHGALLDAWFRDGMLIPVERAHGNAAWLGALVFALSAFAAAWWHARKNPLLRADSSPRKD
jgi:hypothetical protein